MKLYVHLLVGVLLGGIRPNGFCTANSESQALKSSNSWDSSTNAFHKAGDVPQINVTDNGASRKLVKRLPRSRAFYWEDRSAHVRYDMPRPDLPPRRDRVKFCDDVTDWLDDLPDPLRRRRYDFFRSQHTPPAWGEFWLTVSWEGDPPKRLPHSHPWATDGSDPHPLDTRVVQDFELGERFQPLHAWLRQRLVVDSLRIGFEYFHAELYNAMTETTFTYLIVHNPYPGRPRITAEVPAEPRPPVPQESSYNPLPEWAFERYIRRPIRPHVVHPEPASLPSPSPQLEDDEAR